jgi:electron transfer flavoprotein alpha subunit
VAEQFQGNVNSNFGSVMTAASQLNDAQVDVLVHGDGSTQQALIDQVSKYAGISNIIVAKNDALKNSYGDSVAHTVAQLVQSKNYDKVITAASGFGKDFMPRVGGLLDVQPISDVIEIVDNGNAFKRPIYAGNAVATVESSDSVKLISVRPTNFQKAEPGEATQCPTEEVSVDVSKAQGSWVKDEPTVSESAELSSAKFVVSGGRGLKNGENFKLLYDFADALGAQNCAVGASRAAVDAGYVANDMQVGQTGKVVAPDLYVAVGISGAIQHLSGMKDSKVIVAVNKDPDAAIFKVANYGLVDDLFKVMPELTEKINQSK